MDKRRRAAATWVTAVAVIALEALLGAGAGCSLMAKHDSARSRGGDQGVPTTPVPTVSTIVLPTSSTSSLLPAPSTAPAAFGPDRSPDALAFFHLALNGCPESGLGANLPALAQRLDGDRYLVVYVMVPAVEPFAVPALPDAPAPPPPPPPPTAAVLVDLGAQEVTGPDGPEGRVPDPFRLCSDHRLFAGNR